jgi:hypothetical protein
VAGRATGPSGRSVLAVSVEGDRGGALGGGLLDAFELHSGGVGAAGADRATGCGRGRDVRDCGRDGVSKPTVITWKDVEEVGLQLSPNESLKFWTDSELEGQGP